MQQPERQPSIHSAGSHSSLSIKIKPKRANDEKSRNQADAFEVKVHLNQDIIRNSSSSSNKISFARNESENQRDQLEQEEEVKVDNRPRLIDPEPLPAQEAQEAKSLLAHPNVLPCEKSEDLKDKELALVGLI